MRKQAQKLQLAAQTGTLNIPLDKTTADSDVKPSSNSEDAHGNGPKTSPLRSPDSNTHDQDLRTLDDCQRMCEGATSKGHDQVAIIDSQCSPPKYCEADPNYVAVQGDYDHCGKVTVASEDR